MSQRTNQMNSFVWSDLLVDRIKLIVRDSTYLVAMEGPARSAKTALAIQAFFLAVYDSDEQYHLIAGQSYETITRNLLDADVIGLLKAFNLKLERDKIGNSYIAIQTEKKGKKVIRIVPYGDKSKWKSILGATIGVALIDEVNIADKQFILELFARQASVDKPKQIWTLNGDDPEHYIYQEFINYCTMVGDIPSSTLAIMQSFQESKGIKQGYYYLHFKMSDNPVMTPEKIERISSIYPVDSFYYKTKVLGERGVQGDMLFLDYMGSQLLVDGGKYKPDIKRYTIGIDIGESQALNAFVLIGWTQDYRKAIVLSELHFQKLGYKEKTAKLRGWLEIILKYIPSQMVEGIFVDSAEGNFIEDISTDFYRDYGIKVAPSYKATIKERVDMMIIGFSTKRILIDDSCRVIYDSYAKAMRDPNGVRLDDNKPENDLMDATEYALTRHMIALMRGD
jgi:PBSX family phage terminase large subunit